MSTPAANLGPTPTIAIVETHKVFQNTYRLLSLTLLFSAVVAGITMALKLPHPGILLTLVGYFGLLFLTSKYS